MSFPFQFLNIIDEHQLDFQDQDGIDSGTIDFFGSGHIIDIKQPIHVPHSEIPRGKKQFSNGKQNFGARFKNDWNSNENHGIHGSSGFKEINKPFDDISDFIINPFTRKPFIDTFTGHPIVVPLGSAPLIDPTTGFPIVDPISGLPIIEPIISPTSTISAVTINTIIGATSSTTSSTRTSSSTTTSSSADNVPC